MSNRTITPEVLMRAYECAGAADRERFEELVGDNYIGAYDEMRARVHEILEIYGDNGTLKWFDTQKDQPVGDVHLEPWPVIGADGKVTGIGIPVINKVLDLHDLEGGEELEWEMAMKSAATAGKKLPERDEWYIILFFKKQIQKLLEENGGDPLKDDYYWSSTEYNANLAWHVYFGSGYVHISSKFYGLVARAVADI